ncbi:MAG: signal recognition particle protein [Alphaproteobacteria bacterium]|nr:MAG: signal recognition particle protein [Alphaproteobacteria bacterium]
MFDTFSQKISKLFDKITKRGLLTQESVNTALREIRIALLEADVALPVIKTFLKAVGDKAVDQKIIKSVSASDMMIKIIHDELVHTLGKKNKPIKKGNILLVGLQGAGKTTTAGKLAHRLSKNTLLVSLDVYRPAAQEQLKQVGEQHGFEVFPIGQTNIKEIYKSALQYSKAKKFDYVIFDTAGRLHIDDEMMEELKIIEKEINPAETLLVVDSMIGQDAANMAKTFKDNIGLTGIILTRTDGDAKGGAALSMNIITDCPIRYIGTGEKIDALEEFDPERIASRILDMGDIVSLVEQAEKFADDAENEKVSKNLEKGKFDLDDMMTYLKQMDSMGGLGSLMKMMPGAMAQGQLQGQSIDDKLLKKQVAIICSMTPKERKNYKILGGSRKKRIAQGAGVTAADVNKLVKQYEHVRQMMKQFGLFGKSENSGALGGLKSMFGL